MYSRSSLNYLLGLALLSRYTNLEGLSCVLEIGGGFGSLGEILAQILPGAKYVNFDIPPTCLFAEAYLRRTLGSTNVLGPEDGLSLGKHFSLQSLPQASSLANWQIEGFRGDIDLFINFISFQEMEPPVVDNYLKQVDRLRPRWILLRNLREGKQVQSAENGLGVEKPILGEFYEHQLTNYSLVARSPDVFGHATVDGFHSEVSLFERQVW